MILISVGFLDLVRWTGLTSTAFYITHTPSSCSPSLSPALLPRRDVSTLNGTPYTHPIPAPTPTDGHRRVYRAANQLSSEYPPIPHTSPTSKDTWASHSARSSHPSTLGRRTARVYQVRATQSHRAAAQKPYSQTPIQPVCVRSGRTMLHPSSQTHASSQGAKSCLIPSL